MFDFVKLSEDFKSCIAQEINGFERRFGVLKRAFVNVYTKFKLHFYQKVFEKLQDKEASLTTVETFCMEIIYALNKPTVAEFASVANISSPNAAYKINNLIRKGYLKKVQSEEDKREYHLEVTDKYMNYYNISYNYLDEVMERISKRLEPNEIQTLTKLLYIISEELMPEIKLNIEE